MTPETQLAIASQQFRAVELPALNGSIAYRRGGACEERTEEARLLWWMGFASARELQVERMRRKWVAASLEWVLFAVARGPEPAQGRRGRRRAWRASDTSPASRAPITAA